MISAEFETRSRFELDRSVERIAMTGSVEKRRESTAKVKAATVWQDLNRGTHRRQKGSAPGRLVVNRFSLFSVLNKICFEHFSNNRVKPHFLILLVNFR